mgnify:CR=1 FL=1
MKRITKIVVHTMLDTDCPPDYLGAFSDTKGEYAIEHKSSEPGACKYFNAENVENMEQAKENYARYMGYINQQWYMTGVQAKAHIQTSQDGTTWFAGVTASSSGIWGIESDALDAGEYPKEAQAEQQDELLQVLKELGFTDTEISAAPVEYEGQF